MPGPICAAVEFRPICLHCTVPVMAPVMVMLHDGNCCNTMWTVRLSTILLNADGLHTQSHADLTPPSGVGSSELSLSTNVTVSLTWKAGSRYLLRLGNLHDPYPPWRAIVFVHHS